MAQTFELNQFNQTAIKGDLTLGLNNNVISCKIKSDSSSTFTAGTAVKIVDVANSIPVIEKAAATDSIFGFIIYNRKNNAPIAGDIVEVAFDNSVMLMEASASIASGATLEIVATGDTVITNAGTNKVIGRALRKASSGDIIPVVIFSVRV